jgi:hypothetical protein
MNVALKKARSMRKTNGTASPPLSSIAAAGALAVSLLAVTAFAADRNSAAVTAQATAVNAELMRDPTRVPDLAKDFVSPKGSGQDLNASDRNSGVIGKYAVTLSSANPAPLDQSAIGYRVYADHAAAERALGTLSVAELGIKSVMDRYIDDHPGGKYYNGDLRCEVFNDPAAAGTTSVRCFALDPVLPVIVTGFSQHGRHSACDR